MKTVITDYIPQRPPMVMVDELIRCDHERAVSSLQIRAENIFVENKKFTEAGLIENMAQTAAAMVGYDCASRNVPVPVGFIAAVKNLAIESMPDVASTIQTSVIVTNQVMNVTIIEGRVEQMGKSLCTCEMKILIQK